MKKTSYHVNPAVNKWEEEQRRARMEKMIQRAKSTLPPEARGGAKQGGPKKPSPYSAEAAAARVARKQSSGSQEPTASGQIVMDVQELDGLIYNRVQEILGMPILRRAAAARGALKGGSPPKGPSSGRNGRRPAWNNDWNAQAAYPPSNHDERHVGGTGSKSAAAARPYERSPSRPAGGAVASGSSRWATAQPQPHGGAPSPTAGRAGGPGHADAVPYGPGPGMHRQTSLPPATGERVVLLPSPSAKGASARAASARPASARYFPGKDPAPAGAATGRGAGGGRGTRSPGPGPRPAAVATAATAAAAAASPPAPRPRAASSSALPATTGPRPQRLSARNPSHSVPSHGEEGGGGVRGVGVHAGSSAPAGSSSGAAAKVQVPGRKGNDGAEEEEDAYADDDFEEYEGTDEEHAGGDGEEADAGGDEAGAGGAAQADLALLRSSVNALHGLVQLKIQQELARSQQLQQTPRQACRSTAATSDGPEPSPDGVAVVSAVAAAAGSPGGGGVLASMALVGAEETDGAGGPRDLADSGVMDGLRQSDLDYLARLGAGDPHDRHELGNSTDDRAFVIEPGAPAGTAKVWGDRQPWEADRGSGAEKTGLQVLRARQEKEQEKQQQQQRAGQAGQGAEAAHRTSGAAADEDDSVLLGETISPRHRSGAAVQMQAVGSALAALASSGQLSADDAKDLRTQTDALYGSLVQLHNLMSGPRGAELRTASPTGGKSSGSPHAGGFTPTDVSPAGSPTHTMRRPAEPEPGGSGGGSPSPPGGGGMGASGGRPVPPSVVPPEPPSGYGSQRTTQGGGPAQPRGGSHVQLTPKNCLVAEDVAWMAGLVQSLSESLHADNGGLDLPGM